MLSIFGLVFIIAAPILVYRNAKQNGHNAVFWTLLALGVGIGFQIIIPLIIGFILGVVWVSQGYSPAQIQASLQTPSMILGIISLVLSVVGILLIMRRVNTVLDVKESYPSPPPPPPPPTTTDFNQ